MSLFNWFKPIEPAPKPVVRRKRTRKPPIAPVNKKRPIVTRARPGTRLEQLITLLRERGEMPLTEVAKIMGLDRGREVHIVALRAPHRFKVVPIPGATNNRKSIRLKYARTGTTLKEKHGDDHFKSIGRTGGFAANRDLARIAGAKGGKISRRKPVVNETPKRARGFDDPAVRAKAITVKAQRALERTLMSPPEEPTSQGIERAKDSTPFYTTKACETAHLALAAALYTAGHKLKRVKATSQGNATFVFEQDVSFVFDASRFWSRTLSVDAHTYHENIKLLRSKIANL